MHACQLDVPIRYVRTSARIYPWVKVYSPMWRCKPRPRTNQGSYRSAHDVPKLNVKEQPKHGPRLGYAWTQAPQREE